MLESLLTAAALLAGAIASIAGFGIGSLLTPLFALQHGTQLAVAAVSVPHFFATLLRFWLLRSSIDRRVLLHFGILSAAGGLTGALLHNITGNPALTLVFAVLLIFAGAMSLTGYSARLRFGRTTAWFAGGLSGLLGGLVGNQGGIRSAALLGFGLSRDSFVATATATGLIVDAARMPVYFFSSGRDLLAVAPQITLATAGVLLGTVLGARTLSRVPQPVFYKLVGGLMLALGVFMLTRISHAAR